MMDGPSTLAFIALFVTVVGQHKWLLNRSHATEKAWKVLWEKCEAEREAQREHIQALRERVSHSEGVIVAMLRKAPTTGENREELK